MNTKSVSALLASLALALSLSACTTHSTNASPTVTPDIQEDSPAWNCSTMGNRVCGPVEQLPTMSQTDYPFILALKPLPNANGQVCWTEYNASQPNHQEIICGDLARIDQQLDPTVWLHWNYNK